MPRSPSETIKATPLDAAEELNPTETLLYRSHFHWTTLSRPTFFAVFFLVPGVLALSGVPARGGSTGGTLLLGTIGLFFLGVAAAILSIAHESWKFREIILTNNRLILTSGVIHGKITSIRLDGIESTMVRLNLPGKALGYGTAVLCDAEGAVRIKKIPHPEKFLQLLRNELAAGPEFDDLSETANASLSQFRQPTLRDEK